MADKLVTAAPEKVKVFVRLRPYSSKEKEQGLDDTHIELFDTETKVINVRKDYDKKTFKFDELLPMEIAQVDIFKLVGQPVIDSFLQGFNGTIFAYGQTGTGKTHTMIGDHADFEQKGTIPRACEHIFEHISSDEKSSYTVSIGFLQLYMEMLQDLLVPDNETPIRIREDPSDGISLTGLTWIPVKNVKECMDLLVLGDENRSTAFTQMNSTSSRSHAVYMVKIEKRARYTEVELEELEKSGKHADRTMARAVLNLVDLAGSERVKKTGATGSRFDEAKNINLALLALGNCIQALSDKKRFKHVPFRDSKLTRLLEDSLGGNCKTSMVVTIGPSVKNTSETLNTLAFGLRAMKIENTPEVNKQVDWRARCMQLQAEIDRLNDEKSNWILSASNEEMDQLKSRILELEIENDDLKQKVAEMEDSFTVTRTRRSSEYQMSHSTRVKEKENYFKEQMGELSDKIEERDEALSLLRGEFDECNLNRKALKKELKELKQQLEATEKDSSSRVAELTTQLNEVRETVESKESELSNIKAYFDDYKVDSITEMDELREEIEHKEQEVKILMKKFEKEKSESAKELKQLREAVGNTDQETDALISEVKEYRKSLTGKSVLNPGSTSDTYESQDTQQSSGAQSVAGSSNSGQSRSVKIDPATGQPEPMSPTIQMKYQSVPGSLSDQYVFSPADLEHYVENTNAKLQRSLSKKTSNLNQINTELAIKNSELQEKQDEIEQLAEIIQEKDATIKRLQTKIREAKPQKGSDEHDQTIIELLLENMVLKTENLDQKSELILLRINVKELKAKIAFLENKSNESEMKNRQEAAARAIQKFYRSKVVVPRRESVYHTIYEEDPALRSQLNESTSKTGVMLISHTFNSLDSMLTSIAKKFVSRSKELKKG